MGTVTCLPGCCGPYVKTGGTWVCRKCGLPNEKIIPLAVRSR